MQHRHRRVLACVAAAALLPLVATSAAQAAPSSAVRTGPSSSQSPYLLPVAPGVTNTSLLTVGDSVGGYKMVGIPDGLGAYDNGDGTITLVRNHELGATLGVKRAHGAKGAFVSKWVIDKRTLEVKSGSDLITNLVRTDLALGEAIARLCSADLPPLSAFYNAATGKGYDGRIFMAGEEDSASGRAFASVATGPDADTSYELAALGNTAWENVLANPATGDKTVVVGTDDSTPGQVYVYVGTKKTTGTAIEKAGLTGGTLYGVSAEGGLHEYAGGTGNPAFPLKGAFGLSTLGDVSSLNTAGLQSLSTAKGVTEWWRPEDGAWDAKNPNVLYFNTTANFTGPSRVWKLTFADVTSPELGGTFEAILDGTEGQRMLDNMAAADNGKQLILNEDPGNQAYLARVYSYSLGKDRLTPILEHDPARFAPGGSSFLTKDEESSGTIDVSEFFGQGSYLMTTQEHYPIPGELVEGGQLQLVRVQWVDNGHGTKG